MHSYMYTYVLGDVVLIYYYSIKKYVLLKVGWGRLKMILCYSIAKLSSGNLYQGKKKPSMKISVFSPFPFFLFFVVTQSSKTIQCM